MYRIRRINESDENKFDGYLAELEDSDLVYIRHSTNTLIIQMEYDETLIFDSDTKDKANFELRYDYINKQKEYLDLVKRFLDMIVYDYDVVITKPNNMLDFKIRYFEKNREMSYYSIDESGNILIDTEILKDKLNFDFEIVFHRESSSTNPNLFKLYPSKDLSYDEIENAVQSISDIKSIDSDIRIEIRRNQGINYYIAGEFRYSDYDLSPKNKSITNEY